MHRIILYVMSLLCLFLTKTYSQETESFEVQTKTISENIERIISQEKQTLKTATDSINLLMQNNDLTFEEAEEIKLGLAQKSADKIDGLIAKEEEKLVELVQHTVNQQIAKPSNTDEKDYTPEFFKRTNSQSAITFGWRGIRDDKDITGINWGIGFNLKTRIFEDNSLYYIKYGLSYNFQYENLNSSNKYYTVNGNQTELVDYSGSLKSNSAFMNSYLRLPIALEFDFSKKGIVQGKEVYRVNQGFKFSLGGYIGYNTDSRQYLRFKEGKRTVSQTRRADWNVSHWEYGIMATISYKTVGIYVDYGLNPVFRNNLTDQKIISIGVIFE